MWDAISAVMNSFNDFLWGWFMIILLLGTHIFLTIRTKFVQRKTFKAIKLSVTKDPDSDGDISPFQTVTSARFRLLQQHLPQQSARVIS